MPKANKSKGFYKGNSMHAYTIDDIVTSVCGQVLKDKMSAITKTPKSIILWNCRSQRTLSHLPIERAHTHTHTKKTTNGTEHLREQILV